MDGLSSFSTILSCEFLKVLPHIEAFTTQIFIWFCLQQETNRRALSLILHLLAHREVAGIEATKVFLRVVRSSPNPYGTKIQMYLSQLVEKEKLFKQGPNMMPIQIRADQGLHF
jgi:hypothetical protein